MKNNFEFFWNLRLVVYILFQNSLVLVFEFTMDLLIL